MKASPKRCENCRYFDLEEGQAQMFNNPNHGAFVQAAELLGPAEMGRRVKLDGDGNAIYDENGVPEFEPNSVPAKTAWGDAGLCMKRDLGIFKQDTCDEFTWVNLMTRLNAIPYLRATVITTVGGFVGGWIWMAMQ